MNRHVYSSNSLGPTLGPARAVCNFALQQILGRSRAPARSDTRTRACPRCDTPGHCVTVATPGEGGRESRDQGT